MYIHQDQLQAAAVYYAGEFGDLPDYDRWNEIGLLVNECTILEDIEELADCDDGIISYGELQALETVL